MTWGWRPREWGAWGWAWPAAAIVGLLTVWPLSVLLYQSLFRVSATVPDDTRFVALTNYGVVLTSAVWWHALFATALFTAVVVSLELVLGTLFAASLRTVRFSWPLARVVVLVPALTLAVVSAGAMEFAVRSGFLHAWLGLGGSADLASLFGLGMAEVWRGTGFVVVIVYLALARVPDALVESAAAAGVRRLFRRLWWPAVAPAIGVAAVFRAADTLRIVEGPVLRDGPTVDHRLVAGVVWNDAFDSFEQGLASAEAVIMLVLVAALGLLLARLVRVGRAS